MGSIISRCLLDGGLLLGTQLILGLPICCLLAVTVVPVTELIEIVLGCGAVDTEPLCLGLAFNVLGQRQVVMEVVIGEILAGAVRITGFGGPLDMWHDICGVRLLIDAVLYALLCRVTNLRPAVMVGNLRCRVGINHWDDMGKRLDARVIHVLVLPFSHWLNHRIDKLYLLIGYAIFTVKLLVCP